MSMRSAPNSRSPCALQDCHRQPDSMCAMRTQQDATSRRSAVIRRLRSKPSSAKRSASRRRSGSTSVSRQGAPTASRARCSRSWSSRPASKPPATTRPPRGRSWAAACRWSMAEPRICTHQGRRSEQPASPPRSNTGPDHDAADHGPSPREGAPFVAVGAAVPAEHQAHAGAMLHLGLAPAAGGAASSRTCS